MSRRTEVTGRYDLNTPQREQGEPLVSMTGYLATGHPWEALFENWESDEPEFDPRRLQPLEIARARGDTRSTQVYTLQPRLYSIEYSLILGL